MDLRKELPKGSLLNFPGMTCRILETVGKGSNGIVYLAEYQDEMSPVCHRVLIKELFPLEKKGAIYRAESGEILRKPEGEELWEIHLESFERGNSFHLKMREKHPEMIGGNQNTFPLNGTWYSVFECSGGTTLEHLPKDGLTLRKIAERMLMILDALDVFHQEDFLHMDISPDNILIIPQGERENVILIDYNSVSSVDEWQMGVAPVSSTKEGYSAPEAIDGDSEEIGFPADLYSVTAVFYDCLMGRPLSLSEIIAPSTPTGAESKYLADAPETVCAMVKRILHRGLNTLVSRRYADIAAMRADLKELLDRIDCVGVTHAALWEKERARQAQMIRENPSLSFLKEEDGLYPIRIENGDESLDMPAFLQKTKENRGKMILLQAQSGMGKTTSLMAAALAQNEHYSPAEPVAVLLSAFDYREGEQWFIHDRILQSLRFKPDTKSYENARHELDVLLQKPLRTANGERPCVLLFVDGLNEIACDTAPLLQELNELSGFAGVSVVLSSRTMPDGIQTHLMTLCPLEMADIEAILSSAHMLLPESAAMQELLRTPLLLSAYVRASGDNQIQDEDGLLQAMLRKELDRIPEDQPEHWQLAAALHYVLPAIAAEQQKKKRTLSEKELLKAVTGCFTVMKSKEMTHAFSQWTGHRKEILENAKQADDWYGKVVLELLWRRTGFLVRSEDGRFRIVHQQIAEWLAKKYADIQKKIARRRTVRICRRAALCTALAAIACFVIFRYFIRIEYDMDDAEEVVEDALQGYTAGRNNAEAAQQVLAMAQNVLDGKAEYRDFERVYGSDLSIFRQNQSLVPVYAADRQKDLMRDGKPKSAVMPFSGNPFDEAGFTALTQAVGESSERYLSCFSILGQLLQDTKYAKAYGREYIAAVRSGINGDLEVLNQYYLSLIKPEMEKMKTSDPDRYETLNGNFKNYAWTGAVQKDMGGARRAQEKAWGNLDKTAASTRFAASDEQAKEEPYVQLSWMTGKSAKGWTAEETALAECWGQVLYRTEAQYRGILRALDAVDAYLSDRTWENLASARTACYEVYEEMSSAGWPRMNLSQDQTVTLMNSGISADILMDYQSYDLGSLMAGGFRGALFFILEEEWYVRNDLECARTFSSAIRNYLRDMAESLRLSTNYLFLPLDGMENIWPEMQSAYPTVFGQAEEWVSSADTLLAENIALAAQLADTSDSYQKAYKRSISVSKNNLYDMKNGKLLPTVSVTDVPALIPMPEWLDSLTAEYQYFVIDDSGNAVRIGMENLTRPVTTQVTQKGVSLSDVRSYAASLSAETGGAVREGNSWTFRLEGCTLRISWQDDSAVLTWTGETDTAVYEKYRGVLTKQ